MPWVLLLNRSPPGGARIRIAGPRGRFEGIVAAAVVARALLNFRSFPTFPALLNSSELKTLLESAFPEARIDVASGDGVHYSARIVAAGFAGESRIARHRAVYRALGERVGREIHALSLETLTPEEAGGAA